MNSPLRGNKFMFFLIVYFLLISFFYGFIANFFGFTNLSLPINIIISQSIQFGIPFLLYIIVTKNKISDVLLIRKLSLKNIFFILLMGLTIQPAMMFLSAIGNIFADNNASQMVSVLTQFPFITGLLTVALTPAIFEEITFRGIIFNEYKNSSIKIAAIVNGLFFGIMHLDLQQFFYAFPLGIIMVYIIYYTKSILATSLMHFTINASQFCMAYFFNYLSKISDTDNFNKINTDDILYSSTTNIISITIISLIFIYIFSYIFKKFKDYNIKNIDKNGIQLQQNHFFDIFFIGIIIFYIIYIILTII